MQQQIYQPHWSGLSSVWRSVSQTYISSWWNAALGGSRAVLILYFQKTLLQHPFVSFFGKVLVGQWRGSKSRTVSEDLFRSFTTNCFVVCLKLDIFFSFRRSYILPKLFHFCSPGKRQKSKLLRSSHIFQNNVFATIVMIYQEHSVWSWQWYFVIKNQFSCSNQ